MLGSRCLISTDPDLLISCERAKSLSKQLVRGWLQTWMFKGDSNAKAKAKAVAEWLSNHSYFKSHGRHIPRGELEKKKLKILPLEQDKKRCRIWSSRSSTPLPIRSMARLPSRF